MRRTAIKDRRKFKATLFLILTVTMLTVFGWDLGAEAGWWHDIWDDGILGALFAISAVTMMFVWYIPNQTPVKRTRDDRIADTFRVSIALLTGLAGWYVLRHATGWEIGPYVPVALILMAVTAIAIFVPMGWDGQHQDGPGGKGRGDQ